MERIVERAIKRYIKKHFPNELKAIVNKAHELYPELMKKAPDLGGKENTLANNLNMFILVIAYYEASGHRIDGAAIDEILDDLYDHYKWLGTFMNLNRKGALSMMQKKLYKSYREYARKVKEKQAHGEWLETWGMIVDPLNDPTCFNFTLIGCPLVEYAKKYGYMELMPHMCALDHKYAKMMHTRLIRTHTVATGADSCDYRYVPDKSEFAKNYKGRIV